MRIFSQVGITNGPNSTAMAKADLFLINAWANHSNPAMLSRLQSSEFGASYFSPYLLEQISSRDLVVAQKLGSSTLGLSLQQFGWQVYREQSSGLSYAKSFGPNLSIGLQMNYLQTLIEDPYGSHASLSANLGIYSKLSEELSLACLIINPTLSSKDGDGEENYPTKFRWGLKYQALENLEVVSVLEKENFHSPSFSMGIGYSYQSRLNFRLGYGMRDHLLSFGVSTKVKQFTFQIASAYDQRLGYSPQIGISYSPSKATPKVR